MRPCNVLALALSCAALLPAGLQAQDGPPPPPPVQDTTEPPLEAGALPDPTVPGPLLRGWRGPAPTLPKLELRALLIPRVGAPAAVLEVDGVRQRVRAGARLSVAAKGAAAAAQATGQVLVLVLHVTAVSADGVVVRIEPLDITLTVS